MVGEEGEHSQNEHGGDETEENDLHSVSQAQVLMTAQLPILDEVGHVGEGDIETVGGGVEQEQDEELVVGESDTVVHPRTVVVHLEYALPADGTVMTPVWLQGRAWLAVSDV